MTHHDRIRVLRLPDRPLHPDGWLSTLEACVETGSIGGMQSQCCAASSRSYRPSPALGEVAAVTSEDLPAPRVA